MEIPEAFARALQYHQAGELPSAEALYRQILSVDPNHAGARQFLGVVAHQAGRHDLAVEWISRSIALAPNQPGAYSNLGEALRALGRYEEAIAAFHRALALDPSMPDAENNLGNALRDRGDLEQAVAAYRRALALQPDWVETHNNLGTALAEQGCLAEATACYRRAIQLRDNYSPAWDNLGIVQTRQGLLDDAVATFRHALEQNPGEARLWHHLGIAHLAHGQFEEAIAAGERACQLNPQDAEAWRDLGTALAEAGRIDASVDACRRAVALAPESAQAHGNLGVALIQQGQFDEAILSLRRSLALQPDNASVHSNLIFALHFQPDAGETSVTEEHARWNRQFCEPLRKCPPIHANDPIPERRLRIGYLSPDFRSHATSFFLVPLLEAHDHEHHEIYCYSSTSRTDATTARLRASAHVWRDVHALSDGELARQIEEDAIDVLVDLAMHTAGNRLLVFARQPAPVQVSWLAYPGSSGVETIPTYISDVHLEAAPLPNSGEADHAFRLPDCWGCYHPLATEPAVNSLPALTAPGTTFGCLNAFWKINASTAAVFAQVLRAVEASRLLLLAPEGSARVRLLEQFRRHGILSDRISFVGRLPRADYLRLYHQIDIALDPHPYNGITTTCDAFWMGVPVITLTGRNPAGRIGLSFLSAAGLGDLAATDPVRFVQIASGLARDLPRLAALRVRLRSQLEASPLMDAPRFARNLETAYRTLWQRWCARHAS